MVVPVDGDAQVVQAGCENDDDFGVLHGEIVVHHDVHLHASIIQHSQDLQCHVGNDLDVHLTMIRIVHTVNGVYVRTSPQLQQFRVLVDALHDIAESLVVTDGNLEQHSTPPSKRCLLGDSSPGGQPDGALTRQQRTAD